jgi:hypothetical protein
MVTCSSRIVNTSGLTPRPSEPNTMTSPERSIKAELTPDAFMQDCDEEAVAGALERRTRQPLTVFGQSPRAVAWREKPSTYIVCAEDRATPGGPARVR